MVGLGRPGGGVSNALDSASAKANPSFTSGPVRRAAVLYISSRFLLPRAVAHRRSRWRIDASTQVSTRGVLWSSRAQVVPPKSTGGGRFVFEDKVCAYFLAYILADEPPLDIELGRLERVDFQIFKPRRTGGYSTTCCSRSRAPRRRIAVHCPLRATRCASESRLIRSAGRCSCSPTAEPHG